LLGWEPEEWHEFIFDDDGRHIGTKVTREPEWDQEQRELFEALALYEAGVCAGCGFHHSLTENLENVFTFDVKTCNTCAGTARYARVQQHADQEVRDHLGDHAPPETVDPADGRKVYLRLSRPAPEQA
jgi:hypothetical protein